MTTRHTRVVDTPTATNAMTAGAQRPTSTPHLEREKGFITKTTEDQRTTKSPMGQEVTSERIKPFKERRNNESVFFAIE
eukprot:m.26158 g.26158  ORF g.26158 m.26158 type:complete len:79 (-) comp9246_c1_seq1:23-259(-)